MASQCMAGQRRHTCDAVAATQCQDSQQLLLQELRLQPLRAAALGAAACCRAACRIAIIRGHSGRCIVPTG